MSHNILAINNCCGCRSCEQVCPQRCISLKENEEGFLYPEVDSEKCVNCGLCLKRCPQLAYEFKNKVLETYAALNSDYNTLMRSTSGGAMSAFAAAILKNNGVVFGTRLDTKDWKVKFDSIASHDRIDAFRGSKYVQADTLDSYTKVKEYLVNDRVVLFVGTPCQVAGLYKCIEGTNTEKLFTIDILCHGVPAPGLFVKHVEYLEKKYKAKLTGFAFRDKTKFPNKTALCYEFGRKKVYVLGRCEEYFEVFISGSAYRECCYDCKFAQQKRVGDITIGDFWGIKNHHKDFDNRNGVSLILINTDKGNDLLNQSNLRIEKSKIEYAVEGNGILEHPSSKSSCREIFYKDVNLYGYGSAIKKNIKTYPKIYNAILTHIPRFFIDILAQIKK